MIQGQVPWIYELSVVTQSCKQIISKISYQRTVSCRLVLIVQTLQNVTSIPTSTHETEFPKIYHTSKHVSSYA